MEAAAIEVPQDLRQGDCDEEREDDADADLNMMLVASGTISPFSNTVITKACTSIAAIIPSCVWWPRRPVAIRVAWVSSRSHDPISPAFT